MVTLPRRSRNPYRGRAEDPSPCGFYAGDTNVYRYVGDDPTNRLDPSGLEWLDPKNRDIGYTVPNTAEFEPREAGENCLATNLSIKGKTADPQIDRIPVMKPIGFREVPVEGITKLVTPAKPGETEIIIAWIIDKDTKRLVYHTVGRDPYRPGHILWSTKLSQIENRVDGIRDFKAHMEWYFSKRYGAKPEDIHYRAFVVDPTKVIIKDGTLMESYPRD
jgi:hypothetical protein